MRLIAILPIVFIGMNLAIGCLVKTEYNHIITLQAHFKFFDTTLKKGLKIGTQASSSITINGETIELYDVEITDTYLEAVEVSIIASGAIIV